MDGSRSSRGSERTRSRALRERLSAILVAGFALGAGTLSVAQIVRGRSPVTADNGYVQRIGDSYDVIARSLPPTGDLGYFSDASLGEMSGARDFVLAQYFVTPRILRYGNDLELSVGQFASQASLDEFLASRNLVVESGGPPPLPVLLRHAPRKAVQ